MKAEYNVKQTSSGVVVNTKDMICSRQAISQRYKDALRAKHQMISDVTETRLTHRTLPDEHEVLRFCTPFRFYIPDLTTMCVCMLNEANS